VAWDPGQYLKFGGERLRPALDLLARVPVEDPARVADLGCGTGSITRILAERFPRAIVTGVDGSAEMLAKSVKEVPTGGHVRWQQADIAGWTADPAVDLIYSNAALQWLKGHDALFPHLVAQLAPGGALMVQMPRNHGAPSHTLMEASIARRPTLVERLKTKPRSLPPGDPGYFYDLLRPHSTSVDIWETEYLHVLEGADPVVEWTKGTALKPVLDSLEPAEREDFLAEYKAACRLAYKPRADGKTLFPFRRIFIVAVK
jgi:trans-aconitate 2-methyltransferase